MSVMLILEIALGIVLAVVILRFWPAILGGSLILGVLAIALAIGVFLWFQLWPNLRNATREEVGVFVAATVSMGVLYCVPWWLKDNAANRYPRLHALVLGRAPFNGFTKLPLRIAVVASLAAAIVAASIASWVGCWYFVKAAFEVLGK